MACAGCYLLGGGVIGRRGGRQVGHEEARERGAWAREVVVVVSTSIVHLRGL
jgi:hypothetical protein